MIQAIESMVESMKNNYYDSSIEYPDDCIVDFDMRLIDLFKKLDQNPLRQKSG